MVPLKPEPLTTSNHDFFELLLVVQGNNGPGMTTRSTLYRTVVVSIVHPTRRTALYILDQFDTRHKVAILEPLLCVDPLFAPQEIYPNIGSPLRAKRESEEGITLYAPLATFRSSALGFWFLLVYSSRGLLKACAFVNFYPASIRELEEFSVMSTSKPPNPNGEAASGSATPAAPSESTSKVVASSVERHNPFEQLESPVASPPRSQNSQSTNRSTVMSPDSALPVKSRPTGAPSSEVSAVAATAAAAAMATAPTATATTPGRSSSPSVSSLGTAGSLTVPSPARSNADSTPHRRASPGRTTSPTAASVQDQHPQFSNGGQGPHNTSLDEDDSLTEQSTAGNTMDQQSYSSGNTAPAAMTGAATSSLGRLIESTKRMGINRQRSTPASDDDADFDAMGGALLCGYLEKLGRNGKWQRRWFETDGECLSYYKSKKRTRVLATLDLEKVSESLVYFFTVLFLFACTLHFSLFKGWKHRNR